MVEVSGFKGDGTGQGNKTLSTDKALTCPFCHISLDTQPLSYVDFGGDNLQLFLKCKACKNSFIGYTKKIGHIFHITKLSKGKHKKIEFAKEIVELSPTFVQIYNEAESAEQEELKEICGCGYRKALEFLIKDYLIKNKVDDTLTEEVIKEKFLGNCIKDNIDNPKIKQIAEKATWLGNDETHYTRKWESKDLSDLKKLINITVNFILMELQANHYISEMSSESNTNE